MKTKPESPYQLKYEKERIEHLIEVAKIYGTIIPHIIQYKEHDVRSMDMINLLTNLLIKIEKTVSDPAFSIELEKGSIIPYKEK